MVAFVKLEESIKESQGLNESELLPPCGERDILSISPKNPMVF